MVKTRLPGAVTQPFLLLIVFDTLFVLGCLPFGKKIEVVFQSREY